LTGKEAGIELKDNIISINSAFTPAYASFRCLVVNELNGKKAIFDHSSDFTLTDDKMGMFENNPPYIFENGQSFEFVLSNTVK